MQKLLCSFSAQGLFVYALFLAGLQKKGPGLPPLPCRAQKPFLLPARGRGKSQAPARPGACVSPGRAYHRQASQEALNALSPASLAPPLPQTVFFPLRAASFLVLNTISLRSQLTAKGLLPSTAQPRSIVSLKPQQHERDGHVPSLPQYAFHPARCPQALSRPSFFSRRPSFFPSRAGAGCRLCAAGPASHAAGAAHHAPRRFTGT